MLLSFSLIEKICKNRIRRGNFLYPLTPKILGSRDNFIKMKLVDGQLMSNIKTHGEILKLLNWAKQNLWLSTGIINENFKEICRKFYVNKTKKRVKMMLDNATDYTIINNINVGTINELFNKIDFNSLFLMNALIFTVILYSIILLKQKKVTNF